MTTRRLSTLFILSWLLIAIGCETKESRLESVNYDSVENRYPTLNDAVELERTDPESARRASTGASLQPPALVPANTSEPVHSPAIPSQPEIVSGPPSQVGTPSIPAITADADAKDLLDRIRELENVVANLNRKFHNRESSGQPDSSGVVGGDRNAVDGVAAPIGTTSPRASLAGGQGEAGYARRDLNRHITRFERTKLAFRRSEDSYKIDHFMTLVKGFEFMVRDTPQGFNTLPDRDRYSFRDLQEAADELVSELEHYLNDFASDAEVVELAPLLDEATKVALMPPPATGNRLLDFLDMIEDLTEQHQQSQHQQ